MKAKIIAIICMAGLLSIVLFVLGLMFVAVGIAGFFDDDTQVDSVTDELSLVLVVA